MVKGLIARKVTVPGLPSAPSSPFFPPITFESCVWANGAADSMGFCQCVLLKSQQCTADQYPTKSATLELDERQPWV